MQGEIKRLFKISDKVVDERRDIPIQRSGDPRHDVIIEKYHSSA